MPPVIVAPPDTASPAPSRRRAAAADTVPLEAQRQPRARRRRGGSRTPLPLLPIIGVIAGIGLAYVSQSAHSTQATYQASSLAVEQTTLRQQDQRAGDELDRLRNSARIATAAQQLGMKPATRWAYVSSAPGPLVAPHAQSAEQAVPTPGDGVQSLLAALAQTGTLATSRDR